MKQFICVIAIAGCLAVPGIVWLWSRSNQATDPAALYASGQLSRALASISNEEVPASVEAFKIRANCLRQLGRNDEFRNLLKNVAGHQELNDTLQLALALYNIQHAGAGSIPDAAHEKLVATLESGGTLTSDAYSVVIQGLLAQNRLDQAQRLLQLWQTASVQDSAQRDYLQAVYLNVSGELEAAEAALLSCTIKHPRHELSWLALAELYARPPQVRFEQSQLILQHATQAFPDNGEAALRLASIRRRMGRPDAMLSSNTQASTPAALIEKATTEFDLGNYQRAAQLWADWGVKDGGDFQTQIDRAFQLALQGQADAADQLNQRVSLALTTQLLGGIHSNLGAFDLAANRVARLRRLQDLSNESLFRPNTATIDQELEQVRRLQLPVLELPKVVSPESVSDDLSSGRRLYAQHCQHCHGAQGDGRGRAAANLNPPARIFRSEPLRLVSARNRLATDEDLQHTIRHGEPGTAMPAFPQFTETQLKELTAVIRQFIHDGVSQQYDHLSVIEGNLGERQSWIDARTQPEPSIELPSAPANSVSLEQGEKLWTRAGCAGCHALGRDDNTLRPQLFDSLGRRMSAPNLLLDAFHGGDQPASIYKRLLLGIPGTPHPALALPPEQIANLAVYIASRRSETIRR